MTKQELMQRLREIFCDVFDNEDIELSESTCAEDIEEWDSLGHVQLIKELQAQFNITLTAQEMRSWEDVGEMADAILSKLK